MFWYIAEDKKENLSHESAVEFVISFSDEKIKDQKFDAKSMLVTNGVLYDVKSVFTKEMVDGRL